MRTLVDIPDRQIEELEVICKKNGLSRAEVVRRAIAAFIERNRASSTDQAFGLWSKNAEDGLDYQKRMRAEW